jgi:hypothetical protein
MTSESLTVSPSHSDFHRALELKWRNAPPGMAPAMVDEFMARLRAGSTVRKLTCGMRLFGPGLVTAGRFKKHCELHPEWAAEAWRISKENTRRGRRERFTSLTHCKHGHPFSGENLYVTPGGKRKCLACCDRRNLAPRPPSSEQLKQVTAALNAGKPLRFICAGFVGAKRSAPRIVSFRKLLFYRRQNPEFDRFIVSMTAGNRSKAQALRWNPQKARLDAVRSEANDFRQILGMIPTGLPPDKRDDIAQSILLALLEGSLRRDQVKSRVRQFVADHNRMFPTRYAKFGDSPLVSLDEVLFDSGTETRGDYVSRGLWD